MSSTVDFLVPVMRRIREDNRPRLTPRSTLLPTLVSSSKARTHLGCRLSCHCEVLHASFSPRVSGQGLVVPDDGPIPVHLAWDSDNNKVRGKWFSLHFVVHALKDAVTAKLKEKKFRDSHFEFQCCASASFKEFVGDKSLYGIEHGLEFVFQREGFVTKDSEGVAQATDRFLIDRTKAFIEKAISTGTTSRSVVVVCSSDYHFSDVIEKSMAAGIFTILIFTPSITSKLMFDLNCDEYMNWNNIRAKGRDLAKTKISLGLCEFCAFQVLK